MIITNILKIMGLLKQWQGQEFVISACCTKVKYGLGMTSASSPCNWKKLYVVEICYFRIVLMIGTYFLIFTIFFELIGWSDWSECEKFD